MGTIKRNRAVATAQKAKVQSQDYFMEILIGLDIMMPVAALFKSFNSHEFHLSA
jgi:hypothetical protein